ncbi:MAG: hypothetical protein ACOCUF_02665 [Patescibacteria group bacterium]
MELIAEVTKVVTYDKEKGFWFAITKPLEIRDEKKGSITFTGRQEVWSSPKPPPLKSLVLLKEIYETRKGLRANFAEFA